MSNIRTKKRTVLFEPQLIFESQLNLLLHTAQDVGQIADKLRTVKATRHHDVSTESLYLPAREWFRHAMDPLRWLLPQCTLF